MSKLIAVFLAAVLLIPTLLAAQPVSNEELNLRVLDVFKSDVARRSESLKWLQERGNIDVATALIAAHRFSPDAGPELDVTLQALTGVGHSGWSDWMLWQEANPQVASYAGYERLRRALFGFLDPRFEIFFVEDGMAPRNRRIRLEEIVWGGVPALDGIPSLDFPAMIEAAQADYLRDDDLVFGVAINGDVRAYPLRIMGWHEMFNDVVGGVSVALAYCTLCGAGILFDTAVEGRDKPFVFGSSGLLYRSNKLMYDQQTHSLWNQFTGEPVTGELAHSDIRLKVLPVAITTWADWRAVNPGTQVLSLQTGHRRNYGSGVVYNAYFASPELMFPTQVRPGQPLAQKDFVFAVEQQGARRGWPLSAFAETPIINDAIGGKNLVLIGNSATRSVRAYERGDHTFSLNTAGELETMSGAWERSEEALIGPDGTRLPRVAGFVAYWFAWDGYHEDAASLYQSK